MRKQALKLAMLKASLGDKSGAKRIFEAKQKNEYLLKRGRKTKHETVEFERSMVVEGFGIGKKYKSVDQVLRDFEDAEPGHIESREQIFEIGKGRRFRKHCKRGGDYALAVKHGMF